MHIRLNVSYNEKDHAKAAGAQWDAANKLWYLWDYKKIPEVTKWLNYDYNIYVTENIYIVESTRICWGCHNSIPVYSIGADKFAFYDDDVWKFYPAFYLLNGIKKYTDLLDPILRKITNDNFKISFSKTIQDTYLMNHCSCCCRAQGDNYLYDEYDAVFAPNSACQGESFILHKFPITIDIGIEGYPFMSVGNQGNSNKLIWDNAEKIVYSK